MKTIPTVLIGLSLALLGTQVAHARGFGGFHGGGVGGYHGGGFGGDRGGEGSADYHGGGFGGGGYRAEALMRAVIMPEALTQAASTPAAMMREEFTPILTPDTSGCRRTAHLVGVGLARPVIPGSHMARRRGRAMLRPHEGSPSGTPSATTDGLRRRLASRPSRRLVRGRLGRRRGLECGRLAGNRRLVQLGRSGADRVRIRQQRHVSGRRGLLRRSADRHGRRVLPAGLDLGPERPPAAAPQSSDWMPLGVFSLVQGNQTDSSTLFQLALSKSGAVAGNYYSVLTGATLPVHGAVDPKTQRVAWTVGDNTTTVYDAGISSLSEDEMPVLVHFGKDQTQQWMLVRLKQPADQPAPQ